MLPHLRLLHFDVCQLSYRNMLFYTCISPGRNRWVPLDCGGWGIKVLATFWECKDFLQLVRSSVFLMWLPWSYHFCSFSFTAMTLFPCWFLALYAIRGDARHRVVKLLHTMQLRSEGFWRILSTFLSLHQVNRKCVSWGFLYFSPKKKPNPQNTHVIKAVKSFWEL